MPDAREIETMVRAVVETGPEWVQYPTAIGTAGAAIFAGWAALSARSSSAQARVLY
jgi:hypothetical protein